MIQLPEADALTRLEQMTQASEVPALSGGELADLLNFGRRADIDGLAPSETNWTPSWDLNAAAAEGWRRKAGKVAGRFDVTLDGEALRRSQMFGHCLRMADHYASKMAGSVSFASHLEECEVIGNL